jgi:hypothetical protein
MQFEVSPLGLLWVLLDDEVVEAELNSSSCVLDVVDGEGTMGKDHRSSHVGDVI